MSKTLRTRLLEHAGALVLVLAIAVVIGWSLAESHQGVLKATGLDGKRGRRSFVQSTLWAVPANDPRPLFPSQPIAPTPAVRKVADVSKPQ